MRRAPTDGEFCFTCALTRSIDLKGLSLAIPIIRTLENRVRFVFRGFKRETGKPVEGHVEASDAEAAYQVLSDGGIVTESLHGDPEPPHEPSDISDVSRFADALEEALEDALNLSSTRVSFDALTKRYRGKKVRVIDRDKIRQRVAQVVDSTLAASEARRESSGTARERVADAISGLFHGPRNVADGHTPHGIAHTSASGVAGMSGAGLAEQIGRLSGVVEQAEGLIAAMQAALRSVESGGVPRRSLPSASARGAEQNGVLREIFQSNLDLRRAIEDGATQESS